jgi:hypothetical protein
MPAGAGRRKRQRGITECMDEWEAGKVRVSRPIIHYFSLMAEFFKLSFRFFCLVFLLLLFEGKFT